MCNTARMQEISSKSQVTAPENFRNVDIYPSISEILGERKFVLRKNITQGKFASAEQYLDIQFHLLREDFLAPLREGIRAHRCNEITTNIEVYENVKILNDGFLKKIKHPSFGKILDKEDCKKLMIGSLLIFTKNNFKDIWFLAKVSGRNEENLINNEITIQLVNTGQKVLGTTFTMAECCTFFEPYFQVMRVLKGTSSHKFPMEKYIVQVNASSKADLPKYLINSYHKVENYGCLQDNLSNLNSVQAEAFMAALTQEFAVIQGPPGTGKTFLGLKIAETLFMNHHVWYKNSPMLIISHKNHALDHFLEEIICVTQRVVRVGGQSKSDELEDYNLANLRIESISNNLEDSFFQMHIDTDITILQNALVVAMTTTTASRMKETLEQLRSPIVIVEEAAEVLEAHVVAALTQNCQHLILLGDHKQLKPNTSDCIIGTQYRLGVSLFERMVINGIQCHRLEIQYRMVPKISHLLKATVYPFLKDHESVEERPSIPGVDKNLFFFDHRSPEQEMNITSKKNVHEAKLLVALARYLILNCHEPKSIAILTTYSGQVQEVQQEIGNTCRDLVGSLMVDITVSTLDAFQGQEADIVLLSLVRSHKIGFLSAENRICVALSRARNALYIAGNMNLLRARSKVWSTVEECLLQNDNIGWKLVLRCQSHPETITKVSCAEDFRNVSCGGCYRKCEFELPCGHKCRFHCHIFDRNHISYLCREPCGRSITCTRNHQYICTRKCYEECEDCEEIIIKTFDCGHQVSTECSNEICPTPHKPPK